VDNQAEKAEKNTPQFNWVSERSQCSLPKVFYILRQQVEEDVKTRNSLRPANSPYDFSVAENIDEFRVILAAKNETQEVRESVIFSLAAHAVLVKDDQGAPLFEIVATLNEEGKCELYVNQQKQYFWQVRRRALEGLMFRGN
jgi:hypothetical protein